MRDLQNPTFKQRIQLWLNHVKLSIHVQRYKKFYKMVLHERYNRTVTLTKTGLTLITLASAFVVFSSPFIVFLFGLGMYLATTFFEKIFFSYDSLYVHPFPDFHIKTEKWLGCYFGFEREENSPYDIPMVGWVFSDIDYAKKIHSLLRTWSYGELNDKENTICASVVVLNDSEYIFFCYPSTERKTANEFYKKMADERRTESLTDIQIKMMGLLVLGKVFDNEGPSYFPTFRKRYKDGIPYHFSFAIPDENDQLNDIQELDSFILHNLKIKDKKELTQKDLEFEMIRIFG